MIDKIGNVYAKAMIGGFSKTDQKKIYEDMLTLDHLFSLDNSLRLFIYQFNYKILKKVEVIVDAFGLSNETKKCLLYIVKKKRFFSIEKISKSYLFFYEEENNIKRVKVWSADEITSENEENLMTYFKSFLKTDNILLAKRIDKNLVGGIRFEVDDKIYDNSINLFLRKIKQVGRL